MIDLHIHTIATPHHSFWEPDELARTAAAEGLTCIAAVDHNTTGSVRTLQEAGERHGVRVLSGVEIDSGFGGKQWHTLVYGADPDDAGLLALCAAVFERNMADAERLRTELPRRGFRLEGLDALGRSPNVADVGAALAKQNTLPGRVASEDDESAGMRYILTEVEYGYNPVGVDEIVAAAHAARGLAVLAHPGRSKGIYAIPATAQDIVALAAVGLDGIEVFYPTHSAEQREFYLSLARRHGLLVTAGSDSHSPRNPLAGVDPNDLRIAPGVPTILERIAGKST